MYSLCVLHILPSPPVLTSNRLPDHDVYLAQLPISLALHNMKPNPFNHTYHGHIVPIVLSPPLSWVCRHCDRLDRPCYHLASTKATIHTRSPIPSLMSFLDILPW
jgi:hypothetical protein